MTDKRPSGPDRTLRERAEAAVGRAGARPPEPADDRILHELQVHQIELEMQNQELLRAQHELECSRNRYFTMFDLAPVPYFVFDVNHHLADANLAGAELLGAERGRLRGGPFFTHVLPPYRDAFHAHLNGVFAGTGSRTVELGVLAPAGGERWLRLHSQLTPHLEDGTVRVCLTAGLDLTDQRAAERALAETHQMATDLVSHLPTAMFIFRLDAHDVLTLVSVNPEAQRLAATDGVDWRGCEFSEVWPTRLDAANKDRYLEVMHGGPNVATEVAVDADGHITAAFAVHAFRLPDRRLAVSVEDMTEHRRAAADRDRLQAQLLQAQKMESVGRLAGGVAHDFNNMLGVIIGHAELAMSQLQPSTPVQRDLEEIRAAASRSAELTKQLLAFARKQTIAPRVLDLNDTVSGTLRMLQRLVGEDVELSWKPGLNLWPVSIDPTQVNQVLANLVVNARDAIGDTGNIVLQTENLRTSGLLIGRRAEVAPGDYVVLRVSDTGSGMASNVIDHLFEPFFTTKDLGKGTGLGLATVYGIVKQNDGFIDVESRPGAGTTFVIYFKRALEAAAPRDPEPVGTVPDGHETVLIVEDEPAILGLARDILSKKGYRVLTARRPDEAVELVDRLVGDLHLLITDVVMPGMNGQALVEQITARRPGLRCLFMSGYPADAIAERGALVAGTYFIQKPFSLRSLTAKVRQVLDTAPH